MPDHPIDAKVFLSELDAAIEKIVDEGKGKTKWKGEIELLNRARTGATYDTLNFVRDAFAKAAGL